MYNLDERSEFVPGHVHMVPVVHKVAMGQVSLQVLRFSLQYNFTNIPQSTAILDTMTNGQGLGTFRQNTAPYDIRKNLLLCFQSSKI